MRRTIAYQPALDGVRALAVVAVLLFHAGVRGFSGGYLGVSVFFTLSGYLITSLLLHEHVTTGRIDLGAFYARRFRRLLPASSVCLTAVVVLAGVGGLFEQVDGLREQVVGSVLQVANWVFLAGDGSYQNLLAADGGAPSPLEHFWSLAIEEQFYWVWPPFMAVVLAKLANPRWRLRAIAGTAWAAIAAAPLIAIAGGPDAAYWATPARAGEILVGAWVAAALANRDAAPGRWWVAAAPIALGGLAAAVATFPAAGGPAYHGALPLVALASGALLVGLQVPGPLPVALGWGPLVYLGKISYGVYLYHWPVYVLLDERRLGLAGPAVTAVRLAVTLAVAIVSFHAVESPIRQARWPARATIGAALAATTAVVAAALTAVPSGVGTYWQADAGVVGAVAIGPPAAPPIESLPGPQGDTEAPDRSGTTATRASEPAASTAAPGPLPLRLLVIGDSTAEALAGGLTDWAAAHPERLQVSALARPACGVEHAALVTGALAPVAQACAGLMSDDVPAALARVQPDVALVLVTLGDVLPRSWDGGSTTLTSESAEFQLRIAAAYRDALVGLADANPGTTVVWARPPLAEPGWRGRPHPSFEDGSQAAIEAVVRSLGGVELVDLRAWLETSGWASNHAARPEGLHLSREASFEVGAWLVPELVEIAG